MSDNERLSAEEASTAIEVALDTAHSWLRKKMGGLLRSVRKAWP